MKPPICIVRHENVDARGGLVEFADYESLPPGMAGHPRGCEWFCRRHIESARKQAHLAIDAALKAIR